MDLLRDLLNPKSPKARKKAASPRRAKSDKAAPKTSSRRGKRELTAAQAVREAELRG